MNAWPFVVAAYAVTLAASAVLAITAFVAMRRAEAAAEDAAPAMKPKHQRLTLVLLAIAAVIAAGLLAMSGLKDQAAFFYAPADLAAAKPAPGTAIRLGGMVAAGSVRKLPDGVTTTFVVGDGKATTDVAFTGILPDLFREGSGVVAEGHLDADGRFVATNILAKHDERYMPPQMAGKMHKTETLEK